MILTKNLVMDAHR